MQWDRGIKYEEVKRTIQDEIKNIECKSVRQIRRAAYLCIAAIQLRNALRASEAVEAFYLFLAGEFKNVNGKKVVTVKVRKRKDTTREAIWPEFIPFKLVQELRKYKLNIRVNSYEVACLRLLKANSHSLRYARITFLLERGVNPSIVAKITKHSKLDFILSYTQEKIAEKVNFNLY